jgi:hypothetical protein
VTDAQHPHPRPQSSGCGPIDAAAANLGLSRNEYLRRKFEEGASPAGPRTVTAADWQRSAEVFVDLADPAVMEAAWR